MSELRPEYSYLEGEDLKAFMSKDMTGKCATCRFWDEFERPTWQSAEMQEMMASIDIPLLSLVLWDGQCKRHAPVISHEDDPPHADWPETRWDSWCGDHAPS